MSQGLFELDKQTLADLAIFQNDYNDSSIFNLFNKTATIGGKELLEKIFKSPLTDRKEITERIGSIKYFQDTDTGFAADKTTCDFIDYYLKQRSKPKAFFKTIAFLQEVIYSFNRIIYSFNSNGEHYVINEGIVNTLEVIKLLDDFIVKNDPDLLPPGLKVLSSTIKIILNEDDFVFIKSLCDKKKLRTIDLAEADYIFRETCYEKVKILLGIVYQLDVYASVASTGSLLGFTLPIINEYEESTLIIKGLFHPLIKNPIGNNIEFNQNSNVCFVTGANMAGKSTLLKSIGINIYLSQLGFPVPAAYMETGTFQGLITTINISDDIFQGNSHFYSEVLRVKYVANKLKDKKHVFVIFDELFRGTNVKDAFDASLAIISAFAKVKASFFVISTHIVEVANELSAIENINFKYMATTFDNDRPQYSYQLQDGITEERLGMWVVKNEGIVEIIEGIVAREVIRDRG